MIDVAAVTSGRDTPSTRYRIRQHIAPLLDVGFRVHEYCPAINKWAAVPGKPASVSNRAILPVYALWQAAKLATRVPAILGSHSKAITWLSRELLPGYSTVEFLLKPPLVADVDDAIWLTPPFGRRAAEDMARRAEAMIVGNEHLADWFSRFSDRVHVIPTGIDTAVFQPQRHDVRCGDMFVVGWIGSQGNLPFLGAIEDHLSRFFKEQPRARLLVVSDRKPLFQQLRGDQVEYVPWCRANEVSAIQRMDVGLMPLPDSEWARGKCSFKMLQYMAMEVPVVVSPVGMNAEVLTRGELGLAAASGLEWGDALHHLCANRDEGRRLGRNGRKVVLRDYARRRITHQIAAVFESL